MRASKIKQKEKRPCSHKGLDRSPKGANIPRLAVIMGLIDARRALQVNATQQKKHFLVRNKNV